jgi:hypothetical protein
MIPVIIDSDDSASIHPRAASRSDLSSERGDSRDD